MRLREILKGIKLEPGQTVPDIEVTDITSDSRAAAPGNLFIAVKGSNLDGARFIDEAIGRGARAVMAEEGFKARPGVGVVTVRGLKASLGRIAENFFGHPSRRLGIAAVTGTNGKTTVTYLIESILRASGKKAGVIGTINYRWNGTVRPAGNTTPGPIELSRLLADMAGEGVTYAAIEVSSHSLDQRRVDGIGFDAAVFTNITSDHLDYHKTRDEYFAAKKRIFGLLKKGGAAILNKDDALAASLEKSLRNRVVTYGLGKGADIKASGVFLSLGGSSFVVESPGGVFRVKTALIGRHNVSNVLAAAAAALELGVDRDSIRRGVESFKFVPGRLEAVDAGQPFKVFVDYAHTEDAIHNILSSLREVVNGKIITLFGCGGNRDRTKRPLMGRVACRYSDRVVITSDNPRFEDPSGIIAEIEEGVRGDFSNYEIIPDRREAVERAVSKARRGDVVVLAGKGHEDSQIIGPDTVPFDDRRVAREILERMHEGKRGSKGNARAACVRISR